MNKNFEKIVWIAMTRRKLAKVEQSSVALGEEDFDSKIGLSLFLTSIYKSSTHEMKLELDRAIRSFSRNSPVRMYSIQLYRAGSPVCHRLSRRGERLAASGSQT